MNNRTGASVRARSVTECVATLKQIKVVAAFSANDSTATEKDRQEAEKAQEERAHNFLKRQAGDSTLCRPRKRHRMGAARCLRDLDNQVLVALCRQQGRGIEH